MNSIISVENLTKDYGNNKGNFNVSFEIEKGEVFGFLGPNGAGKTTTIRHLLGFSKPESGISKINNIDCWLKPDLIQKDLGYLPGEIAFPDDMTGSQYIKYIGKLRKMKDYKRAQELIRMFELDASGYLKRMSKGMKQKVGIVCAFMHEPNILILDEPTSGLDPLMQSKFVELILSCKEKGATILMSSHSFEEVEKTCDRIALIRQGRIVSVVTNDEIKHAIVKEFKIEFITTSFFTKFIKEKLDIISKNKTKKQVRVKVKDDNINEFIKVLSNYKIKFIKEIKSDLEDYFMTFYKENKNV